MKQMHFPNRIFQIWEYKVSHAQLLIRSPKSSEYQNNIDIAFVGVEYISLPTFLTNFSIVEPNKDELDYLSKFKKSDYLPRMFVFKYFDNHSFVIAAQMKIFENSLEFSETSLESF